LKGVSYAQPVSLAAHTKTTKGYAQPSWYLLKEKIKALHRILYPLLVKIRDFKSIGYQACLCFFCFSCLWMIMRFLPRRGRHACKPFFYFPCMVTFAPLLLYSVGVSSIRGIWLEALDGNPLGYHDWF